MSYGQIMFMFFLFKNDCVIKHKCHKTCHEFGRDQYIFCEGVRWRVGSDCRTNQESKCGVTLLYFSPNDNQVQNDVSLGNKETVCERSHGSQTVG